MANEEIDVLGQMVMARRVKQRLFGASAPLKGSRYVPIERIGQGGAGTVYRAYDSKLRREVAIKLLHVAQDAGIDREQVTQVMMREARSLASLSHPHVVAVHDVGRVVKGELVSGFDDSPDEAGPVFLVMEYIEGQNLGSYIREKRPGYEEILSLFEQAAKGLRAAHDVGLVHRDFKPANVLVGKDGRVRVIDFGLAREEPEALAELSTNPIPPSSEGSDEEFSQASGIVGTPAYMSPEARSRMPVGPKSDQFSFCVAFYEAVYGLRPMACANTQLPAKIPTHLHRLPRGTPPDLDRRLAKGLQVDPDARYPSLNELMGALRKGRSIRLVRWWPALVGPGLAIGAWMLWGDGLLGECREDPQVQRIQGVMQGVEESFADSSVSPQFTQIREVLHERLNHDLLDAQAQCTRGTEPTHQQRRWLEFRLASVDALNKLAQNGVRPDQLWRLRTWADEIAQDADLRDDEPAKEQSAPAVSPTQWTRCLQTLVQADSSWAQARALSGALLEGLHACGTIKALPLVARIARRLDRAAGKTKVNREAYFLAVQHRHFDLAAEMAIRVGHTTLDQKGWAAASEWLKHAQAWHQNPIEKSCPALQNLSARVNLGRDPRAEHYEEVLASWSDSPAMKSYRWSLAHDYLQVLRDQGKLSLVQKERGLLKDAIARSSTLGDEASLAYLQLQAAVDELLSQHWDSARQQLDAVPNLPSLQAEKDAVSLWVALASESPRSAIVARLEALQAGLLREIQVGGCPDQQDTRWETILKLEEEALRAIGASSAQLSPRCPSSAHPQDPSLPLDLDFSRKLLSRLSRGFMDQMNREHPLQGRCPQGEKPS